MKQKLFQSIPKPPPPTLRNESVALEIAKQIVDEVNLDEFYWTKSEIPDRVFDVQHEIMRGGNPSGVFERLHKRQPLLNCKGDRRAHPYGWEGIDSHCRHIASDISKRVLKLALEKYFARYHEGEIRNSLKLGMLAYDVERPSRKGRIVSITDINVVVRRDNGKRLHIAKHLARKGNPSQLKTLQPMESK